MIPDNILYTKEHEWIREEGDTAYVGITEFAQEQLGDITYIELPVEGREVKKDEDFCAIESVKAASDVYAPAGGVIVSVNSKLDEDPGLINRDPYGEGWICTIRITDKSELSSLMKSDEYKKHIKE
jgi:glycine cleavage system H protein